MAPKLAKLGVKCSAACPSTSSPVSLNLMDGWEGAHSRSYVAASLNPVEHLQTESGKFIQWVLQGLRDRNSQSHDLDSEYMHDSPRAMVSSLSAAATPSLSAPVFRVGPKPGASSGSHWELVDSTARIGRRRSRVPRIQPEEAVLASAHDESQCFASMSQALSKQPTALASASLPSRRPSARASTTKRRPVRQRSDALTPTLTSNPPAVQSSPSSYPSLHSKSTCSLIKPHQTGSVRRHRVAHQAKALPVRSQKSVWRHLVAGGLAGAASRTATAPLETLRLRMMVASSRGLSLAQACRQIWAEAGWRAFFRGNALNVLRSTPQKALDFFVFESAKQLLARGSHPPSSAQTIAAGAMAGAASTLALYPLDVVRSRMTVASARHSGGVVTTLRHILKTEGAGALYQGLAPSLLSIIPEAAITYGCFDLLKDGYRRATGAREAGVLPSLACGVASAFTGQLVAYPLELVARRMQVAARGTALAAGGAASGVGGAATAAAGRAAAAAATTAASASAAAAAVTANGSLSAAATSAAATASRSLYAASSAQTGLVPKRLLLLASTSTVNRGVVRGSFFLEKELVASLMRVPMVQTLRSIITERGMGGLYQGIVPASMKVIPMAMVSFGVYESAKFLLERLEKEAKSGNQDNSLILADE